MYGSELVEMARVKDGLIAATVSRPQYNPRLQERSEESEGLRLWRNIITLVALIGLILFWLSIPAWIDLRRPKKTGKSRSLGPLRSLGQYDRLGRLFASARKRAAV